MCGLCGEIRWDGTPVYEGAIERMMEVLAPRGPEASGVFRVHDRMVFGHRRLKIMDLGDGSHQPMVDDDLGLGLVFNGAIYNHPDLRNELETMGYAFRTHGDTEVLLKAYHAWGESFVHKLKGMFAFVIWKQDSGEMLLVRDRLGIKPLYYSRQPHRFRFASTLPALLTGDDIDTTIDPVALHHYMSFHAVVPAPHTIIKGVRKLPPATMVRIDADGGWHETTYWQMTCSDPAHPSELDEEGWKDRLETELRAAISRRMVADVPVGVLLSGGVDSSLVVGMLAEEGQKDLQTFSVGFESVGGEKGDEFAYSDIIARHYGTRHHRIEVPSPKVLDTLPACIQSMSEPMVSHDVIGFYLLSQTVSEHIKVVQSGQGADEVFGGYSWYPPLAGSADPVADYARVFFDRSHDEYADIMHPSLVESDHSRRLVEEHFARAGAIDPVDKALRLDTTIMLVDDPVKRVDNMTMAWGLEARVPFLDHELVEMAASMPSTLKVRGDGKWVLKEVARRVIPSEVIDRPKGYFPVPALKHLRGDYLAMVKDALYAPAAKQRGLFQSAYVERLLAAPSDHITPLKGSKLWQLGLLELWLQTHGIE
ncbi:MAG: N-acetylglutaminylglutamine amidotransferase [Magnetococcales bacterium]|nr:N-acetylglutaminylglutamine amidotransferase [Magnetococcales bacterium]